jgi:hypothetical protein
MCGQNGEFFSVKAGGLCSYLVSYSMKGSMYISEFKIIYLDIKNILLYLSHVIQS